MTMGANAYFGSLQLYAATTLPGFCRLAAHQDPDKAVTAIAEGRDAPAIVGDASLAYLIHVQTKDGDRPQDKESEWVVHAFGEQGHELAEQLAATVLAWDRHVRADDNDQHADPVLTVHPADTPDALLPAGDIVDKDHCRLVFRWPGRDVPLPRPVEHPGAEIVTEGVCRWNLRYTRRCSPRRRSTTTGTGCGAHTAAARQFEVSASGPEVWGWQGRTLGRRAGDCWLRVVSAAVDKAGGRLWEGRATADTAVPRSVSRPRLRGVLDWASAGVAYRAELTEYVPVHPVTRGTSALARDIALPDAWWSELKSALATLATVPTDRESVRQGWVDRNFRRFLGIDPVQITETTTGHADLHWANLTREPLALLDWENWGRLPVGYDLGLFHAYSLATPATAARIRREFAHVLDTDACRTGELVALAQLPQACTRGVHPTPTPLIARRAEELTHTPVPSH
ncbi:hypothetical protein ABZZ79_32380 [Streptomyces sp. NPDC006458]|uniref:hypothetical protein n=1 Tax=Streptomyces sp. NPDC006458 TaxID=3154302 RepID=UPI0033A43051